MRVAIYGRVSTSHQVEHQTIEQQLGRLTAHVGAHAAEGWALDPAHVFRDDGYSGAALARPGLDRLRDAIKGREVDRVLVTAPDRLARNYVHQMVLLEEWARAGCAAEFLDRPMSDDPHDHLLLQIRGAVAEYERTLIAERMRRGRLAKLRAGALLPWTYAPYGYRLSPDRPRDPAGVATDPAEAAVVAELFAMYREPGTSLMQLAIHLDARRAHAPGRAAVVQPHGPGHPAQPDLHGAGACPAHAVSRRHPPPLGNAPDRPPSWLGRASAGRHLAARRTGARHGKPDALRRGAGQVGHQPILCSAEQHGAPLPAARLGELRAVRPGLHGARDQRAELLLPVRRQGPQHLLAPRHVLPGAPHARRPARRTGVERPMHTPGRAGAAGRSRRTCSRRGLAAAGTARAP